MVKDLTVGKPSSVLWRFSIPMFVSVIFQQMYNIADSVVAGKFAGEAALAAVGASYPITMIFMAVAVGSNIGCAVVISQLFGAKRWKEMKTAIYTTLIACIALSLGLMALGFIFCHPVMNLIQTPEDIFSDGALYLRIYIGGFLFLYLYNVCTGIFTSLGDSRTPLYFLIGSSLGNILLDMIFVIVFHWGVAGVAWATFIAQGAACVLALLTVHKRIAEVKTEGSFPLFSWNMLKKISVVAVPSILQQSFISVGNMFIQGLVNSFGSPVIAGYSAAVKLNTFTITSFTTLANGLSSFTAQNIGAGQEERVKSGFKAGWFMAFCVAVPFTVLFFFFGAPSVTIFMEQTGGEAMNTGITFFKDCLSVLRGGRHEADGGWRTEGLRCHGLLYDCHICRSDSSCPDFLCPCRTVGRERDLDVVAHWLDHCHGAVSRLLSEGKVEDQQRFVICDKKKGV